MKRILRILTIALAAVCMFILTVSAGLAESTTPVYSAEDLFTDRDLEQTADRTDVRTPSRDRKRKMPSMRPDMVLQSGFIPVRNWPQLWKKSSRETAFQRCKSRP